MISYSKLDDDDDHDDTNHQCYHIMTFLFFIANSNPIWFS